MGRGVARGPVTADPLACRACRDYWLANQDALRRVCAALAAEHGQRPGALLRDYLVGYHQAGHRTDRL